MKRRKVSFAAALSALMAVSPALAAAETSADASAMRVNQGRSGPNSTEIVLPFGKSAVVDLPRDARDVMISNPTVADAVVRTPRRVYVIGRALGQTNAFFFDASGAQIANLEIRVEPDVAPLNAVLQRNAPGSNIHAEAVNASVVLSGTVRSAAEADAAMQIARTFLGIAGGQGANGSPTGGGRTPGTVTPGGAEPPRLINLIQVEGSEQVMVRVRVVEMSRTLIRQLGVNLNYNEIANTLLPDDAFVNIASQNGFSVAGRLLGGVTAAGGVADTILQPSSLTYPSGGAGTGLPTSTAGVGGYNVEPIQDASGNIIGSKVTYGPATATTSRQTDASIQAFERAGLLRILAEPNLTAVSGEPARFLAGGEFPVPVNSNNGQISVEFKPFGVGLAVTPVVLSGGRISLKLSTEVSELTSDGAVNTGDTAVRNTDGTTSVVHGITIPALQVRRAETTVEMPSGGSLMMAGLIRESTRHVMEGLPGAMNLPVLGTLFRSRDFQNNETELVVLVTPYLVHAAAPDQMRSPADGFRNPTEGQAMFNGRLNALYRGHDGDETADRRELGGKAGHVIP
ncbi:MAG: type II and III secretion system protein family protein [Hyphomonadaceae bacterium]